MNFNWNSFTLMCLAISSPATVQCFHQSMYHHRKMSNVCKLQFTIHFEAANVCISIGSHVSVRQYEINCETPKKKAKNDENEL